MTSSGWIPSLPLGSASKLPCVGPRYPQQQHVHTPALSLNLIGPALVTCPSGTRSCGQKDGMC